MIRKRFALWMVTTGLWFGATGFATAQYAGRVQQDASATAARNDSHEDATTDQRASSVVTLSGCLEEGPTPDKYLLYGPDANAWELKADNVYLIPYLSEAVSITAVTEPTAQKGPLRVTSVTLISNSCSR